MAYSDHPPGSTAAARAQVLHDQADAYRRLADSEALPEKRKLLLTAAARFDELAAREQRIANSYKRTGDSGLGAPPLA